MGCLSAVPFHQLNVKRHIFQRTISLYHRLTACPSNRSSQLAILGIHYHLFVSPLKTVVYVLCCHQYLLRLYASRYMVIFKYVLFIYMWVFYINPIHTHIRCVWSEFIRIITTTSIFSNWITVTFNRLSKGARLNCLYNINKFVSLLSIVRMRWPD